VPPPSPRPSPAERERARGGTTAQQDSLPRPHPEEPPQGGVSKDGGEGRGERGAGRRALAAWCAYDWASSAFPTIITTFLFGAYFARGVAETPEQGQALWGGMMSLTGFAIAILSPVIGAVADQGGRRKPWLAALTILCVGTMALLWFVRPDADFVLYALAITALATLAFELATVFYNAMLPDLAPRHMLGRLSGWGWACGYAGGLASLAVALVVFVQPEVPPFGLDKEEAEPVRAVTLLAAAWFAIFCLPLFLWTPDRAGRAVPAGTAVAQGLRSLWRTLGTLLRQDRNVGVFLLARMIYADGLATLFAFGGIYAAGAFDMELQEVLLFGILLNVASGIGVFAFAWVDDWLGSKPTIFLSLVALVVLGLAILLVGDKTLFYALAVGLGLFIGPAQSASRSLMARLAPPDLRAEYFGLFALTGKVTAFLGPLVLSQVTLLADDQRAGMATIPAFLLIGLALLLLVREPRGSGPLGKMSSPGLTRRSSVG
jgi:UMF1 family MFS transporter